VHLQKLRLGLRRSSEAQRRCINGGGGRTMNW
jgi:hypothetical protein